MSWAETQAVLHKLFLLQITNTVNLYTHRWLKQNGSKHQEALIGNYFLGQCSVYSEPHYLSLN